MKKRAIITEILIWTIILTLVFCGIIFGYSKIFVEPNVYSIQFKDINGITKGSPVRFMGINVGYVRKLTSVDKSVAVQILITKKNMKIPNGTTARVEFYGLGGSKSIELMPSNTPNTDGIVTTDNIRIADVVHQAKGFVQIIEIIEKFVRSIDENALNNILEEVKDISPNKIEQAGAELNKVGHDITKKAEIISDKQSDMANAIKKANNVVLKINKFVKKENPKN